MKCQKTTITPELASILLERNKNNRTVSDADVSKYARDMKNGNWALTHQGILIGKEGNVIDGQHRLMAVVKSGVSIDCFITYSDEIDSAISMPLDVGRKRQDSFIVQKDNLFVAVCNLALRIKYGRPTNTISELNQMIELIGTSINEITLGKATSRRGVSKAPILLTAVVNHMASNKKTDYQSAQYNAMIYANRDVMSPNVWSFFSQLTIENRNFGQYELLARGVHAFNEENKHKTKNVIKDMKASSEKAIMLIKSVL